MGIKKIVHMSDFQTGYESDGSLAYNPTTLDKVVREIARLSPDAIVLTGDLTNNGFPEEYNILNLHLKPLDGIPRLAIPGNHDVLKLPVNGKKPGYINTTFMIEKYLQQLNFFAVIAQWDILHNLENPAFYFKDELVLPIIDYTQVKNDGLEVFREFVGPPDPVLRVGDIMIYGFDSTEGPVEEIVKRRNLIEDWDRGSPYPNDRGYVGLDGYERFKREIKNDESIMRISCTHHHVLPIPINYGLEVDTLIDSGDFLYLLSNNNVKLNLSGHRHIPWVHSLQATYDLKNPIVLLSAGSPCSPKIVNKHPGYNENSYNIITVDGSEFMIERCLIQSGTKQIVYQSFD